MKRQKTTLTGSVVTENDNQNLEVTDFDPLKPSISGDTPKRKEWNSFKSARLSVAVSTGSTPLF